MTDDGYFDARVAEIYDQDRAIFAPEVVDPMVDRLAELCSTGRALELGIGTGRIALPLSQRGIDVAGIDLSSAMVEKLREKPDSEHIEVVVGDFATTTVPGQFALVYLIFNTINNLTTQAAQVQCFRNAAAHLAPGGVFVIEVGVPRLQQLPPGETILAFDLSDDHWGIDEYDVVGQGLVSHHLRVIDGEAHRFSAPFRYVWPAELDLMAELAGLARKFRWGGWARQPFTRHSTSHVSVWEKPAL